MRRHGCVVAPTSPLGGRQAGNAASEVEPLSAVRGCL